VREPFVLIRSCWCALSLLAACLAAAGTTPAHAQTPTGLVLSGRVADASSGAAVRGALVAVDDRGPRAIADSTGAFQLIGVTPGRHRVTVSRFGYATREMQVAVSDPPGLLVVSLDPSPIALEGVGPRARNEVNLVGTVRDATTGASIPWVSLTLTPDAVRTEARGASDMNGVFQLEDVRTGRYLLRVQQVGYVSQYVAVTVGSPPEPVDLRLQPDSVVQAGLVTFSKETKARRNAFPGIATQYDAEKLNMSGVPDAQTFLNYFTWAHLVPCEDVDAVGGLCVQGRRGQPVEPRVFIDELPIIAGLDVLRSYSPSDFYVIEVFGTSTIRAYTHSFVEQRARRPRAFLPVP
jgi:hypothetical protein